MIDDGDGRIAPYGANGDTTNSATSGPGGKDFADPSLPAEVGGMAPQAGGTTPYHGAVDADCATSKSPARGNTTMGTECDPLTTDRTGPASPLPTNRDTY